MRKVCMYRKNHSICRLWYYPMLKTSTGGWNVSPTDEGELLYAYVHICVPICMIGLTSSPNCPIAIMNL